MNAKKKAMERVSPSPPNPTATTIATQRNAEEETPQFSCSACFKLRIPWVKQRNTRRDHFHRHKNAGSGGCDITASLCAQPKKPKLPRGGFKYDPLSYAQNFDDGAAEDRSSEEYCNRGFSYRFAAAAPPNVATASRSADHS